MMPTPNTIWHGDNLAVMRAMDDGCVDLVYLDPPYDSGKDYALTKGAFGDRWSGKAIEPTGHEVCDAVINVAALTAGKAKAAYLSFMAIRLIEIRRILKDTGSVYLHVDPSSSHYLKLIMDAVYGKAQFKNEVIWCYTGISPVRTKFVSKHDVILFYSKGAKWTFNADAVRIPHVKISHGYTGIFKGKKKLSEAEKKEKKLKGKLLEDYWIDCPATGVLVDEWVDYPTQKPLKLLQRIIKASSNEGDLVFDPFIGSGTTLAAAEQTGRRWIGSDQSIDAVNVAKQRLEVAHGSLLRTEVKVETASAAGL